MTTEQSRLMNLLDDAGFTSVVATNTEQEYLRELVPGDHLTTTAFIESVSEEKATGLGVGHFVTTRDRVPGPERRAGRLDDVPDPEVQAAGEGGGEAAPAPAVDQPRQRLLVRRGQGAPAGHPEVLVLRRAAPPARADVPAVPLARVGGRRRLRQGHRLQLRDQPLPAGPVVRLPAERRR